MPPDAHSPHLAAIARARDAGFEFLHLHDGIGITAIRAERHSPAGVVETVTLCARTEAVAARYRIEDYHRGGHPLWERTGTVAEIITELLNLPAHGRPGAPTRSRSASSSLWRPGGP